MNHKNVLTLSIALGLSLFIVGCAEDDSSGTPTLNSGTISGGPFTFIVDDTADNVGGISVSANNQVAGMSSTWVITDNENNILGMPATISDLEAVDFNAAGPGICLIWYLTFNEGLEGLAMGENANDLSGNFDLSDPITVNRIDAPSLSGGPFYFAVGDGNADNLASGDITVDGGFSTGDNSGWVVTDSEGDEILGLPSDFTAVDFDGAGEGTCLVWYITYGDGLTGLTVGESTTNLNGIFELSNSIRVDRIVGAGLTGGPFNFIVDGSADNLSASDITITSEATNLDESGWVVTDAEGNILGLPDNFTGPDFDAAGSGTCLIWYITYKTGLSGLALNNNVADLDGVYALSNEITVNRLDAPTLAGGPINFTVGDGTADNLSTGDITVTNGFALEGQSSWVITDGDGNILGLPDSFTDVNFDSAGSGSCFVWYITYAEGLAGLAVDQNVSGLSGTYELSDSVEVVRTAVAN